MTMTYYTTKPHISQIQFNTLFLQEKVSMYMIWAAKQATNLA